MKKILSLILGMIFLSISNEIIAQEENLGGTEVEKAKEVVLFDFKIDKIEVDTKEIVLAKKAKNNSFNKWAKIEAELIITQPKDKKNTSKNKLNWISSFDVVWYVGLVDNDKTSPTKGKIICLTRKVQYLNAQVSKSVKDAQTQKVSIFLSPKVLERYGYEDKKKFSNYDFVVYAEVFYAGERVAVPSEKLLKTFSLSKGKEWWIDKALLKDEVSILRKFEETPFWSKEAWETVEEAI